MTPTTGQVFFVNGTIKLTASATSTDSTIKSVDYYINGGFIMDKTSSPYTFNTASDAPNTWVVTALATAKNGNTSVSAPVTVSIVQDVAPAVSLTSPGNGATYAAKSTIPLSATAASQYSTISNVEFFKDSTSLKKVTTAPYTYSWPNVAAGTYTLTAVATDAQGLQTTSAPVSITVN